jgi:hypothetical protein
LADGDRTPTLMSGNQNGNEHSDAGRFRLRSIAGVSLLDMAGFAAKLKGAVERMPRSIKSLSNIRGRMSTRSTATICLTRKDASLKRS